MKDKDAIGNARDESWKSMLFANPRFEPPVHEVSPGPILQDSFDARFSAMFDGHANIDSTALQRVLDLFVGAHEPR